MLGTVGDIGTTKSESLTQVHFLNSQTSRINTYGGTLIFLLGDTLLSLYL